MKHLAMALTAALMLGSIGASTATARIHQHQGIGGPGHHHGKHPR